MRLNQMVAPLSFGSPVGLFRALIAAALLLVTQIGNAADSWDRSFETISLRGGNFELDLQKTRIVSLDSWRYVQQIVVRAEPRAGGRGTFTVWANGEQRAVVEPSMQRETVIEIKEALSAIEFRNHAGASQVIDVTVVQGTDSVLASTPRDPRGAINQEAVLQLCRNAMALTDQLRPYTNFANYGTFLLPIRKSAARAYATASVRPGLSELSRTLGALEAQIAASDTYLNEAFEMDAAFNLAIELLTLKERIADMLD